MYVLLSWPRFAVSLGTLAYEYANTPWRQNIYFPIQFPTFLASTFIEVQKEILKKKL